MRSSDMYIGHMEITHPEAHYLAGVVADLDIPLHQLADWLLAATDTEDDDLVAQVTWLLSPTTF